LDCYTHLINFIIIIIIIIISSKVQTHTQKKKGTLKPPIRVGDLEEDALNGAILKVGATNELSN
jgi:hypothetical protein